MCFADLADLNAFQNQIDKILSHWFGFCWSGQFDCIENQIDQTWSENQTIQFDLIHEQ